MIKSQSTIYFFAYSPIENERIILCISRMFHVFWIWADAFMRFSCWTAELAAVYAKVDNLGPYLHKPQANDVQPVEPVIYILLEQMINSCEWSHWTNGLDRSTKSPFRNWQIRGLRLSLSLSLWRRWCSQMDCFSSCFLSKNMIEVYWDTTVLGNHPMMGSILHFKNHAYHEGVEDDSSRWTPVCWEPRWWRASFSVWGSWILQKSVGFRRTVSGRFTGGWQGLLRLGMAIVSQEVSESSGRDKR